MKLNKCHLWYCIRKNCRVCLTVKKRPPVPRIRNFLRTDAWCRFSIVQKNLACKETEMCTWSRRQDYLSVALNGWFTFSFHTRILDASGLMLSQDWVRESQLTWELFCSVWLYSFLHSFKGSGTKWSRHVVCPEFKKGWGRNRHVVLSSRDCCWYHICRELPQSTIYYSV